MTGIKVTSMACILAATDAINPVLNLPYEQFTAMGLSAFCVWQMWRLINKKDTQLDRLISALEQRPCLHGQLPKPEDRPA